MTTKPVKPVPPPLPDRAAGQEAFSEAANAAVSFQLVTGLNYSSDVADFCEEQADIARAAALAGDLPPLTGQAGRVIRANADATAAEFGPVIVSPSPSGTSIMGAVDGQIEELTAAEAMPLLVETGNTANGYYEKWADGRLECRAVIEKNNNSTNAQTFTFPHAFVSTAGLVLLVNQVSAFSTRMAISDDPTATQFGVLVVNGGDGAANNAVRRGHYIAKGFWK